MVALTQGVFFVVTRLNSFYADLTELQSTQASLGAWRKGPKGPRFAEKMVQFHLTFWVVQGWDPTSYKWSYLIGLFHPQLPIYFRPFKSFWKSLVDSTTENSGFSCERKGAKRGYRSNPEAFCRERCTEQFCQVSRNAHLSNKP